MAVVAYRLPARFVGADLVAHDSLTGGKVQLDPAG